MTRILVLLLALAALVIASGCVKPSQANYTLSRPSFPEHRFEQLVATHPNLTFRQLADQLPQRDYVEHLSFDPAEIKFYDETVERLQLTDDEQKMLRTNGFVSVDHNQAYSFGPLYYAVYTSDLPVLITTDSILYAMHCTYDDALMEMEQSFFTDALDEVLEKCHDALAKSAPWWGATSYNYHDVDLYLTVARNLLKGAGAPATSSPNNQDTWSGILLVPSKLGQDQEAKKILGLIQSLVLQDPLKNEFTDLYGGQRPIDYSQFRPRGHYTKNAVLARYFRTMMWLGRADTGWNTLPPDSQSGIVSDTPRELRNAVLLTELLQSTGAIQRLSQMNGIIDFMVGSSDNLTVFQLSDLLTRQNINAVGDLVDDQHVEAFQNELRHSDLGTQQIRSQIVLSDPDDLYQVPPPSLFQMFGQRFVIDSFVLSKVVYDSIIHDGQKVERMMPTGLDVMVALGNNSALPLLQEEMEKFPYAANLQACREFVSEFQQSYWTENLYNIWLDALRTLNADLSSEKHLPEAMRTAAWQRKQIQTQLASWAELRHNTVLYAKEPYTSNNSCEYPTGYVEPHPETYARIKYFATEAARRIEAADFKLANNDRTNIKDRQVKFFNEMAETLGRIEDLARKELAAQPFTAEDQAWIKGAINATQGCDRQGFSGWYSKLFYRGPARVAQFDATVIDVHTDPNLKSVLEEGVGCCNFLVVAIDNDNDRMIYVGPAYSYYEFQHPASDRLTDEAWQKMLGSNSAPPRPSWTTDFQAPALSRRAGH